MADDTSFQGTFAPPTIGTSGTPIPVTGAGSITITPDALVVKGFRGKSTALLALVTLVTVAGVGLGAVWVVSTQIFNHASMSTGGMGGAIAAGILSAAALPKRSSTIPFELSIPWGSVRKATFNAQNKDIQITIKKHKPSGIVHFKPTEAATQLVINTIQSKLLG